MNSGGSEMSEVLADKDYYLDARGELTFVEEEQAFLLVGKDCLIPVDVAKKYGLPRNAKKATPAENKAETPKKSKKGS